MSKNVRAAVLTRFSQIEIQEFKMPVCRDNDGILKVEAVGVCGTDPKIYNGKVKYGDLPLILGHEILGWIAEIGREAKERWKVKEGDRVVVGQFMSCGCCDRCRMGEYRFCENVSWYGGKISSSVPPHLWGAYAEYMYLHPRSMVHKISEKIPAEAGVLITAVIANGIRWGRIIGNFCLQDAVVIQGAGQEGLALVAVARESGCSPIIITGLSIDKRRLKLALELGADYAIDVENEDIVNKVSELTGDHMADVVVDVTGNPGSIMNSVDLVKKHGTLVFPTLVGTEVATPIITDRIVNNEIKFVGAFSSDALSVRKAIKLVESGKYFFENLVTHRFPLEKAERALQVAGGYFEDEYPVKCIITP
jgi:alcohol dehydrogenase